MSTKACKFISGENVMPGWGCCECRSYNGLQRRICGNCGHIPCNVVLPMPHEFGMCDDCGAPKGMKHVGHLEGEVVGGGSQTVFTMQDKIDEEERAKSGRSKKI